MSAAGPPALWRPLTGRPAPGSEGPDDPVLRGAVLAVHLAAMLALVAAGLLPPAVAVVTAATAVGLSLLARACLVRPRLNRLRIALWTAAALLTLVAPFVVAPVAGLQTPTVLGVFVAGFLAATSADQDGTRRAMLMNLVLGLAVLGLGAGLGPLLRSDAGPALVLPVAAGWAAALVVLARAARRHPGPAVRARVAPAPGPRRGGPSARAAGLGAVAVTMAVSLLAFAAVTHLPASPPPAQVSGPPSGGLLGDPGAEEALPRSVSSTYSGGSLDLRSRGDLPTTPVMLVPQSSPVLWRSATLDAYDGAAWLQTSLVGDGRFERVSGTVPLRTAQDPPPPAAATRTDAVRWLAPGAFAVPRPGVALELTLDGAGTAGLAADGTLFHRHGGTGSRADDPVGYTVTSAGRASTDPRDAAASGLDAAALRAAVRFPAADEPSPYTDLPAGLPQRVRDLAAEVAAGRTTRYDVVRAVEDHLRSRAVYTLDAPVPAAGQDAVDHFLFESREGFCEQFASAQVVLLRSLGVPARMAVGFAGGEPAVGADGAPADDALAGDDLAGMRLVRGTQAHAWAEVWFPGVGWVASDPTAGTRLAEPSAADRLWDALAGRVVLVVVVLAVLLLAAVALGVALARRRRPDAAPGGVRRAGAGAVALLAAFDRLEAALARAGVPRQAHETLAELGERLARGDERATAEGSAVAAAEDAIRAGTGAIGPVAALAVLERLLYAAAAPPPGDLLVAADGLDAAAARVLAAQPVR